MLLQKVCRSPWFVAVAVVAAVAAVEAAAATVSGPLMG